MAFASSSVWLTTTRFLLQARHLRSCWQIWITGANPVVFLFRSKTFWISARKPNPDTLAHRLSTLRQQKVLWSCERHCDCWQGYTPGDSLTRQWRTCGTVCRYTWGSGGSVLGQCARCAHALAPARVAVIKDSLPGLQLSNLAQVIESWSCYLFHADWPACCHSFFSLSVIYFEDLQDSAQSLAVCRCRLPRLQFVCVLTPCLASIVWKIIGLYLLHWNVWQTTFLRSVNSYCSISVFSHCDACL